MNAKQPRELAAMDWEQLVEELVALLLKLFGDEPEAPVWPDVTCDPSMLGPIDDIIRAHLATLDLLCALRCQCAEPDEGGERQREGGERGAPAQPAERNAPEKNATAQPAEKPAPAPQRRRPPAK